MADFTIELDSAGMEDMLVNDCRGAVDEAGAAIADAVSEDGVRARTYSYTTDRAGCAVAVRNRFGLANEARRAQLMRAAASLGLELKPQ
ncbi:hypothetical protein [Rhodococcoides fascians]|uniref:hypothetical protein n=1 Tax=Rhodococcoides fascians TaxID=1828 RepID=UPI00050C6B16|nr:hypothetical protein [Rhodococcus fascians]